ncbi:MULTISPECIES: HPr family phosphocarrier protein [Actinomadura]|jgi:phosphocarrier protein|uniref:HPr family phosphocarrier protein n=1 Tax=Actinomadura geliboluensis TaxID=882440 RepID=A0A5S4GR07_9ACTN|nr:HPr family phosphocarrier protein [Actinomadura geliboluensis]TMR35343.1 HPr family phosphocarrier protein [Actinomadura geliboluensis]
MPERSVVIASAQGLHARPAQIFVHTAARQPVRVSIRVGDRAPVPASSILGVLSLGAARGTEVTLSAEGDGAAAALDELADLLARDLDAEEPDHA